MKIEDLSNDAVNWLVAKHVGHTSRCAWMLEKEGYAAWQSYERAWGNPIPNYVQDWGAGGPIIELEKIDVCNVDTAWVASRYNPKWHSQEHKMYGSTPLRAAMCCYLSLQLGDDVVVPKELM